jgi:hypothetical protein
MSRNRSNIRSSNVRSDQNSGQVANNSESAVMSQTLVGRARKDKELFNQELDVQTINETPTRDNALE